MLMSYTRLSNRKRKRDVDAGSRPPFKLKLRERFLMLLVYCRLYIGNSLMIAIPSQVVEDLRLKVGDYMLLDVKDSTITIRKQIK